MKSHLKDYFSFDCSYLAESELINIRIFKHLVLETVSWPNALIFKTAKSFENTPHQKKKKKTKKSGST